ncbi:XRE family transcriptional regulator [Actinomadura logoneensis]|uniref:XRE family transcriptional regulator n=1 Tax=Actinomadura logoneensis TaxID=2293572 RepID=A0A372JC39_9ACTN|nr:helix-turn-helix transcriptional regulator [Actinomadura logoneensis]RFU37394.1 XRE family transcriptional regulator [Actinomadura logoneensis]
MGRPERPLDRDAGPVPAFADELRKLRRAAGNPSYRVLASRANYSHTVLSDATRGERLPTLAVTLAFVRACGGDPAEWEARWHLHRQLAEGLVPRSAASAADTAATGAVADASSTGVGAAADASGTGTAAVADASGGGTGVSVGSEVAASGVAAASGDATRPDGVASSSAGGAEPTSPGGGPAPRQTLPGRPPGGLSGNRPGGGALGRYAAVAVVVAVVAGTCGWWLRPVHAPARSAEPSPRSTEFVPVDDGTDPKIAGCNPDGFPRDNVPVRLDRPATLHGRTLMAGTQVGTVYLFYSPRCAGAWTRFVPTPGLNPHPTENSVASLTVQVDRPIDGTASFWRMGHLDSSYSNLLLVGIGCVTGTATVRMTGQDAVGTAHTRCLGRP